MSNASLVQQQEIHCITSRISISLEYGKSHITKPHPPWSHLSISGPGPPSSQAIAVVLETTTSAITTVSQQSQSACSTLAGGTTQARSSAQRAYTFNEPVTSVYLPFRMPRPHQLFSLVNTATWLTLVVQVPAVEQTKLSSPIKLNIVAKHPKTGEGTSEQHPEVSLTQPSSALLTCAAATSLALLTNQDRLSRREQLGHDELEAADASEYADVARQNAQQLANITT